MIHCTPHPFGVTEKRETCYGNIAVSVVQSYRLWGLFSENMPPASPEAFNTLRVVVSCTIVLLI